MIIYLYIFHENSLLTLEIICLISTLYIIIYLTSLHCFYYVVFNVGYRQYQSHALINYHYHYHDREYIWGQLSKMPKNSGFFISEDFPKSVSFNRKKMLPIFHKARKS